MKEIPAIFLNCLNNKSLSLFVDNEISKMRLKKTSDVNEANIVITDNDLIENMINIFVSETHSIVSDNSGNVVMDLKKGKDKAFIELALINAVSVYFNKSSLELFDLKIRQKNKISKFLQALVVTMEVEDAKTKMSHSQRVSYYSGLFAKFLNKSNDEIEKICELSMLHDIGRIGIEQLMLFTPTRINDFETWDLEHTITGSVFLSSLDELWFAVPTIRSHHEHWDGTGYPDSLFGEEIPYYARFIGLIDWFDLATHTASSEFEGIMSCDDALNYIKENSGSIFDPLLGLQFFDFMKEYLKNNKFI
jgi:HD-GYP domain-containing protein (c-di-GMP phosphodiesterase class II)